MFTKSGISTDANDMDAVFARVKEDLRFANLDKALEEAVNLEGWPHVLCESWIKDTRRKLEVESLVELLENEVRTL